MEKTNSTKYMKQRKFLLMLPVISLPFITLMFWALGGGKGSSVQAQPAHKGLNLRLPDAKLKDEKGLNKLSFYQQAALDSLKAKEAERLDPYWNKMGGNSRNNEDTPLRFNSDESDENVSSHSTDYGMDANKMKVYSKLDELKKALDKSKQLSTSYSQQSGNYGSPVQSYSSSNDIERLQSMMQRMKDDKTVDPEIDQLNSMLDKIMVIQNPQQAKEAEKPPTDEKPSLKTREEKANISLLESNIDNEDKDTVIEKNSSNGFYGQANDKSDELNSGNSIEAIIPETQILVAGATVKLALGNDVTINEVLLPSGTFIYGTASVTNERLKIEVNSIRIQNSILHVSLQVYDMDGQEGIYIPGSINRTVAKESANNAVGGMNSTTIDPSIGAQAASAGIEAAKSLFNKKVKLVKMTVRAGYKVLLRDSHEK